MASLNKTEHIGEADYGDPAASLRPIPHLPEWIMDNIRSFLVPDPDDESLDRYEYLPDDPLNWDMMHDSISDPNVRYDAAGKYNHICCPNFLAVDIDICRKHFDEHDEEWKGYLYPDDMLEEKALVDVMGYVVHD